MNEEDANAAAAAASDADAQDAGDGDGGEGNEEAGEGTTPEEVAQVLKGAGMDVKVPAAEDGDKPEDEEDAPADGGEDEDAPADDDKPVEEPAKPDATKAEDAPTDEEAPTFTMTVQDANGQSYNISAGDDLSEILEDFEPKNNGQILQIVKDLLTLEGKKESYDASQAEEAATAEREAAVSKILDGWDKEIDQLVADKRLDSKEADRVGEVREFMSTENAKREADGRPLIGSFEDALDKLEAIEAREAAVQAKKDAKENARKNGALVGGASAPASGKPTAYRVGSARNMNEAIRQANLLQGLQVKT